MLTSVVMELFNAFSRRHAGTTVWKVVVTGFGRGFVLLQGSERVGEIRVWEDELGFEVEMGYKPIGVEREKRRGVEKSQIARCWEILLCLGPQAWSMPGTPETEKEFAARWFTSLQSNRVLCSSCVC